MHEFLDININMRLFRSYCTFLKYECAYNIYILYINSHSLHHSLSLSLINLKTNIYFVCK